MDTWAVYSVRPVEQLQWGMRVMERSEVLVLCADIDDGAVDSAPSSLGAMRTCLRSASHIFSKGKCRQGRIWRNFFSEASPIAQALPTWRIENTPILVIH
jgi:hypothetical protein